VWPDGWWYLGTLEYGGGDYTSAAVALSRYIDLTPNAGPAMALRGLCEFELNQYPQALQDLEHGVALGAANQPRNAGIIFYHQSLLLTRLGRFEEALEKYSVMIKHGEVSEDIICGIGTASLRLPLFPKQVDAAQRPLVCMVGRASAAVVSGNLADGDRAFSEVFQRFPGTPNLHYSYGYLLSTINPQHAIAQLKQELEISPHSASAHAMLAWVLGIQGDFALALPYARQAAEQDPSLAIGQLVLGRDLIETGDPASGLPHLDAVLKGDPNNLEAHLALAKAYSKMGRRDEARRERLLCLSLSRQGKADANL
jgi:tetratricopeptide (TPR) repeat protein